MQGTRKLTETPAELQAIVDQRAPPWPERRGTRGAAIVHPVDQSRIVDGIGIIGPTRPSHARAVPMMDDTARATSGPVRGPSR